MRCRPSFGRHRRSTGFSATGPFEYQAVRVPSRLDSIPPQSRRLLEEAGYHWDPSTGMWINNRLGRAISYQALRDHDAGWLRLWLQYGED